MQQALIDFIEAHPHGWGHRDWLDLLESLGHSGHDVTEPDAVGLELENQRLAWELRRRAVPGLGPKRIDAVVGRFQTLWRLQHAEVEEIAGLRTIPEKLAERVVAAVR